MKSTISNVDAILRDLKKEQEAEQRYTKRTDAKIAAEMSKLQAKILKKGIIFATTSRSGVEKLIKATMEGIFTTVPPIIKFDTFTSAEAKEFEPIAEARLGATDPPTGTIFFVDVRRSKILDGVYSIKYSTE